MLVLWFILLIGAPLGWYVDGEKGWGLGLLSFLGWLFLSSVIATLAGQSTWMGASVMATVWANYLVYDWDRPLPPPVDPKTPTFDDPVFAAGVAGLVVGAALALLVLASAIPAAWLGPASGVLGLGGSVLLIAMVRWGIDS